MKRLRSRPCGSPRSSGSSTPGTTRAGPSPGTRSAWSAATPTQEVRRILFAVDPVAAVVDEAVDVRRRPARRPPPAAADPGELGRGDHRQGAGAAPADAARDRAAHRPHQRRRAGRRGQRLRSPARSGCEDARGPRADRRRRRSTSWSSSCRSTHAERGAHGGHRGRCRGDRRLRLLHVHHARGGPVPAARGRRSRHRAGRRARGGRRRSASSRSTRAPCAEPVVEALRAAHPYEEPAFDLVELADVPGGPVTGHRPRRRRAATAGSGPVAEADDAARVRRPGRRAPSRRPRTAYAWPATPTGRSGRVAVGAGSGESLLEQRAPQRRRRLRDLRPQAPPGGRVPRGRRPGAGRRRALGRGVELAAGGGARRCRRPRPPRGIRWRPTSARLVTRPVDLPRLSRHPDRGARPESRPLRPAEAARRAGARQPARHAPSPGGEPARGRRAHAS